MKNHRKLLAIVLSVLLAFVPVMTAFAETEEVLEQQTEQEEQIVEESEEQAVLAGAGLQNPVECYYSSPEYVDGDVSKGVKNWTSVLLEESYTVIDSESKPTALTEGWYVVDGTVDYETESITVSGSVQLVLLDGCSLTVAGGFGDPGIQVAGTDSLTVYAGNTDTKIAGDGELKATGGREAAGIGGGADSDGGCITINGGKVTATGGRKAAGIGGGSGSIGEPGEDGNESEGGKGQNGYSGGACGDIVINGGVVKAYAKEGGAAIGGGCGGLGGSGGSGDETFDGGDGGNGGAGGNLSGSVIINGGRLIAVAAEGNAIGVGQGGIGGDAGAPGINYSGISGAASGSAGAKGTVAGAGLRIRETVELKAGTDAESAVIVTFDSTADSSGLIEDKLYVAMREKEIPDPEPTPPASEPEKEPEEPKPEFTGNEDSAVSDGGWNCGPGGIWTYRTNGQFRDTWGYIKLENGTPGWFWFDRNGVMQTGWQQINGKWYYFNQKHDGTYGMMLANTLTPDGYRVDENGAWIP